VRSSRTWAKVYRFSGSAVDVAETVPEAAARLLDEADVGCSEELGLGLADGLDEDATTDEDVLVVVGGV